MREAGAAATHRKRRIVPSSSSLLPITFDALVTGMARRFKVEVGVRSGGGLRGELLVESLCCDQVCRLHIAPCLEGIGVS